MSPGSWISWALLRLRGSAGSKLPDFFLFSFGSEGTSAPVAMGGGGGGGSSGEVGTRERSVMGVGAAQFQNFDIMCKLIGNLPLAPTLLFAPRVLLPLWLLSRDILAAAHLWHNYISWRYRQTRSCQYLNTLSAITQPHKFSQVSDFRAYPSVLNLIARYQLFNTIKPSHTSFKGTKSLKVENEILFKPSHSNPGKAKKPTIDYTSLAFSLIRGFSPRY